jgi:hypothetical protein
MDGLSPVTQLLQSLVRLFCHARGQCLFQSAQFRRYPVMLGAGRIFPESPPPRSCPYHIRLAYAKSHRYLGICATRIQHAISQILPIRLSLTPPHDRSPAQKSHRTQKTTFDPPTPGPVQNPLVTGSAFRGHSEFARNRSRPKARPQQSAGMQPL